MAADSMRAVGPARGERSFPDENLLRGGKLSGVLKGESGIED